MKLAAVFAATTIAIVFTSTPSQAGYRKKTRTASSNTAPVISGSPSTSVQAASAYAFTPSASDAQNDRLTFSITNKPTWASFSNSSGTLAGVPASTQTGTYSNIKITVSDGLLTSSLPAFSITVTAPPATQPANSAPVISGTPPTSVTAGTAYSFTPKASDADGNTLGFSVANKPAWAIFSTATGSLTGTPSSAQAGTYSGISISVSDGSMTVTLPSFQITVTTPVLATGSAALTWSAPSQNTDGTSLTDLAGFKVYHGTSATALTDVVQIQGPTSTAYTYTQLASGTHYFAVSAYNNMGEESALSTLGVKTVP